MIRLTQICALFVTIFWCQHALSSPIFENINVERKVSIELKPINFRPFTFIKEKWGPFGKYIMKHTLAKRDLNKINTIDGQVENFKPLFEERFIPVIEKGEIIKPAPPFLQPVKPVIAEKDSAPVSKLHTDISEAIAVNPRVDNPIAITPSFTPLKVHHLEKLGAEPIVESSESIEGPLFVPVTPNIVTQPVVPPTTPPPLSPANVEVPPSSGIGAFARFVGEILSEIVNRLIARARLSFAQFANTPPAAQ